MASSGASPAADTSPADIPFDLISGLLPTETVDCATDGSEGKRILAVYLYPTGQADDYWAHVGDIRKTLSKIDDVWDAAADPYDQHPRWACAPKTLLPTVVRFRGPAIGSDGAYTFGEITNALAKAGFDSTNRIYLIFADHVGDEFSQSGRSTLDDDDRPDPSNANNIGPAYSMIDAEGKAWTWSQMWAVTMHELGHGLGAVQCSAPHSSCPAGEYGHHHCWDEYDVMCYEDGGSYYTGEDGAPGTSDDGRVSIVCGSGSAEEVQWDCGKDDYFNVAPASGSYLATHWNLRNSRFVTPLRQE